ncbi:hypothetical protein IAR55_006834 [Kwoniella newhampshirensis]|uniref:RING-type domain-containing protein n=1 Tax=Kwoniella newhampshirensis TaxID=1651941 RepID=A0AAW0YGL6_9TREE
MRKPRLEDASCAICMDQLFDQRDDLDDVIPIATCDCGHVFHEICLLEWFRTQSIQYLNAAREQGVQGRHGSPSLSDAPAECPSCRAECFADPETGEPTIHRLFIDFGNAAGTASQAGSSPVKSTKGKDKEVMGLARRARGVAEEVNGLSAESEEEDMQGMLRRSEGLAEDLVSVKALNGVKKYVGHLTVAIRDLKTTLENHPRLPGLLAKNEQLEANIRDLRYQIDTNFRREIKNAVDAERAKGDVRLGKVRDQCQALRRALEKEQVARKTQRKAVEEREMAARLSLHDAEEELRKEREDRERLQDTLNERTKQLRLLQSRNEGRKNWKSEVEKLKAENAKLKSDIQQKTFRNPSSPSRHAAAASPVLDADQYAKIGDDSVQAISDVSGRYRASGKQRAVDDSHDESLQIDMPSFDDDPLRSLSRLLPRATVSHVNKHNSPTPSENGARAGPSRAHPTARTIQFDLDQGLGRKRKSSKYFTGSDKENLTASSTKSDLDDEWDEVVEEASPSPPKRSKTNPFATTRKDSEKRKELPSAAARASNGNVIIPSSSPPPRSSASRPAEVIDLATSSPPSERALLKEIGGKGKGKVVEHNGRNLHRQGSAVDRLGLMDVNGRPKKGVATGQKVKRKV